MNNDLLAFLHAGHFSTLSEVPAHRHTGAEIVYVINGSCTIDFADKSLVINAGELCITAPGEAHAQHSNQLIENYYVVFNANPDFFDCTSRVINVNHDENIALWLRQLVDLNDQMYFQQCTGLTYAVLSRITMLEARLNHRSAMCPQLHRALKYIENHLADSQLSLDIIAGNAGISVSYLKKLFQAEFNTSPMKFVRDQRMRKSLQMLHNQYLFINEICEKCGYPSPNYFARIFKKMHKKTPSEFRQILNSLSHDISSTDS